MPSAALEPLRLLIARRMLDTQSQSQLPLTPDAALPSASVTTRVNNVTLTPTPASDYIPALDNRRALMSVAVASSNPPLVASSPFASLAAGSGTTSAPQVGSATSAAAGAEDDRFFVYKGKRIEIRDVWAGT